MEIESIFINLKKSPIFAISLSSKELFHSNFWAWLIEYKNEFAKVFFQDIQSENLIVQREVGNRDLTIISGNSYYIIENKLKSLPDEKQIKRYQQEVGSNFRFGCITGVVELKDLPDYWHFCSYKQIGEKIKKINFEMADNRWFDLINEYADVIINIDTALSLFNNEYGPKLVTSASFEQYPILKKFEDIRFADICKKCKSYEFTNFIKQTIAPDLEKLIGSKDTVLSVGNSYSNKSSLNDIRFIKNAGKDNEVVIGIQIQDNQYRYCFVKAKGFWGFINKEFTLNLFNELLDCGWFSEYNKSEKFLKGIKSSMRDLYCKYETDNYKFVYQYYNLSDNEMDFRSLSNKIYKDMVFASTIINSIND